MVDAKTDVVLKNFSFSYPDTPDAPLEVSNLEIRAGEKVALVGASGAGKTTLLKLIDGRLFGWSGQASVLNHPLSPDKRLPREVLADIGFVFQDFALIDRLSVFENVRIGRLGRACALRSLAGGFSEQDMDAVERAIRDAGLEQLCNRRVDQLSGGQRQRVAVARCLAQEPRIVIADEPVSNLDPAGARATLGCLHASVEARGATLIVSSHQPKLVSGFVDRFLGLKSGRILFDQASGGLQSGELANLYGWQIAQPAA